MKCDARMLQAAKEAWLSAPATITSVGQLLEHSINAALLVAERERTDWALDARLWLLTTASSDLAHVSFHSREMQEWFTDFIAELREVLPMALTLLSRLTRERDVARIYGGAARVQEIAVNDARIHEQQLRSLVEVERDRLKVVLVQISTIEMEPVAARFAHNALRSKP